MTRLRSIIKFILKVDIIINKIYTRIATIKKDIIKLLEETCVTIALLLDKWQSNNKKKFLEINSSYLMSRAPASRPGMEGKSRRVSITTI